MLRRVLRFTALRQRGCAEWIECLGAPREGSQTLGRTSTCLQARGFPWLEPPLLADRPLRDPLKLESFCADRLRHPPCDAQVQELDVGRESRKPELPRPDACRPPEEACRQSSGVPLMVMAKSATRTNATNRPTTIPPKIARPTGAPHRFPASGATTTEATIGAMKRKDHRFPSARSSGREKRKRIAATFTAALTAKQT